MRMVGLGLDMGGASTELVVPEDLRVRQTAQRRLHSHQARCHP